MKADAPRGEKARRAEEFMDRIRAAGAMDANPTHRLKLTKAASFEKYDERSAYPEPPRITQETHG